RTEAVRKPISAGLYIPSREWVIEMRAIEALNATTGYVEPDVWETFRRRIGKHLGTRLAPSIAKHFTETTIADRYPSAALAHYIFHSEQGADMYATMTEAREKGFTVPVARARATQDAD